MKKSIANLERVTQFYKWMNSRQDVEIVKFTIDAKTLYNIHAQPENMGFWHNAIVEGITEIIDTYLTVSEKFKDLYAQGKLKREEGGNICFPDVDSDAYHLYRILKYQWLYESVKDDCQHAPVQMIKDRKTLYRFHPGSDKTTSLYLLGRTHGVTTNAFYIWYKDLDPNPIHLNFDYEVVKTPQDFADMFVKFDDRRFRIIEDVVSVDHRNEHNTEPHFNVFCQYVQNVLNKSNHVCKEFNNRRHISYNDTVHHDGISVNIDQVFDFVHSVENEKETFTFPNGLKFVKVEPQWDWQDYAWVPEFDQHEV